jgi:outer membrane protein
MKKLFKVALVAVCFLAVGNFAKAQTKIGHINFEAVVQLMPEFKTVEATLQTYQKQYVDQIGAMQTELQTKGQEYTKGQATMTDAVRASKQAELQDMQNRIQSLNQKAQTDVEAKSNELFKPLSDKARTAIESVAKEKGYGYVINSNQTQLLVSPPADDLTDAVKAKLGLK